jgi:ABC-2 type transport system ATP-binding protein
MADAESLLVRKPESVGDTTIQPAILATKLTKRYGKRLSVDGLDLAIAPGELYALLGDNGAGKTTTINILTTLLSPTAGEFFICGHNGLKQAEKCKRHFGVVSQDVAIYQELTASENLRFVASLYGVPKKELDDRIKTLLEHAGLLDRANDPADEFSIGMQRKLSIAMAILPQPKVLFMDEPTVGLDPVSRKHIWEMLVDLKQKGVTILLTTHYLEEAEALADRVGIIRQGKLLLEGTVPQLREKLSVARHIVITLADAWDANVLEAKLETLHLKYGIKGVFEPASKSIIVTQQGTEDLAVIMKSMLSWLEAESIKFTRFDTHEPSLEEMFLSIVTKGGA